MITTEILHAYAPYGLQMQNTKSGRIIDVRGLREGVSTIHLLATVKDGIQFKDMEYQLDLWPFKPILRPLSELTDEEFKTFGWADFDDFEDAVYSGDIHYSAMISLIKQHYNVFNLHDGEFIPKK